MKARVVVAVGQARKPGVQTLRGEIARFYKRIAIKLLRKHSIPSRVVSGVFSFGQWLTRGRLGVCGASKGNTFENDLLLLIFNATAIANIADNAASSPLTNLYIGLHTGDPGEAGNQTTNEISYADYARVAVARSGSGWTVSGNSVSPAANIDFATSGGGAGGTVTHMSIGTAASSTGKLLYKGTVTPNIVVTTGVLPRLTTATAITED